MSLPERKEVYTYEDYLNWPGEHKIEIIDGQVTYTLFHQEYIKKFLEQ